MEDGRIEEILGAWIVGRAPLHGGDLSAVTRLDLSDGRRVVLKTAPMAGVEADMLAALDRAGAPVPRVLHRERQAMLMDYLPPAPPSGDHWVTLGRALRALHDSTAAARPKPSYGWSRDYAFGAVEVTGGSWEDWPTFWAEARLGADIGRLPRDLAQRVAVVCTTLPEMLPRRPPAALLHGDLWQGNVHFGPEASAHLVDPACCYGHAEVDLAMLHMFGQPGRALDAAYGALEDGWEWRRPIYQLWPALVHYRLFGEGYRRLVEHFLAAIGA